MTNLKARAFAAYLGSEVHDELTDSIGVLDSVCITDLKPLVVCLRVENGFVYQTRTIEQLKLNLKNLSSITDVDALEVIRILCREQYKGFTNVVCSWVDTAKDDIKICRIEFDAYENIWHQDDNLQHHILHISTFGTINHYYKGDIGYCTKCVDMIDYLRSRSYNLPFMGVNLIKENIAIIKTEE